MKEEASSGTGDPKFPKIIWPPKRLCPSCYFVRSQKSGGDRQIDWDHDEVFRFLVNYYGKTLMYNDKELLDDAGRNKAVVEELETSTDAVVPLGAAFAFALACCTFGALACLWRSKQKNCKYFYQLHSLKNI